MTTKITGVSEFLVRIENSPLVGEETYWSNGGQVFDSQQRLVYKKLRVISKCPTREIYYEELDWDSETCTFLQFIRHEHDRGMVYLNTTKKKIKGLNVKIKRNNLLEVKYNVCIVKDFKGSGKSVVMKTEGCGGVIINSEGKPYSKTLELDPKKENDLLVWDQGQYQTLKDYLKEVLKNAEL